MRMSKIAWGLVTAVLLAAAPAWADEPAGGNPCGEMKEEAKPAPKKAAKKVKKPAKKAEPAAAEAVEQPAAPSGDDEAAAEMKAGTGVNRKKKEIVGEAAEFPAGTKVWVWSRVNGAKDKAVFHVWKRDDKQVMKKEFTAKSNRYRTWTRLVVKPGNYTVEVQDESGAVLGSTTFVVGDFSKATAKAE